MLAMRLEVERHRGPRRDAVARRQRDPEGARRLPLDRVAAVRARELGPVRPALDQPRPHPRRRRAQQGARPLRDRRRHPLSARPGPRRDPAAGRRSCPTSRVVSQFHRDPAIVDRNNPFVRVLSESVSKRARLRDDQRRPRRRLGRDLLHRRRRAGGRVRPGRRRPPRPRRVGLARPRWRATGARSSTSCG